MTRIQDHNPLRWEDKPGTWTSRDSTDHEHLQQRITSIVVMPPSEAEIQATAALVRRHAVDAGDEERLLDMLGVRDG